MTEQTPAVPVFDYSANHASLRDDLVTEPVEGTAFEVTYSPTCYITRDVFLHPAGADPWSGLRFARVGSIVRHGPYVETPTGAYHAKPTETRRDLVQRVARQAIEAMRVEREARPASCVAYFDRPAQPQCPEPAADTVHKLCTRHLDEWHAATNARWSVTLHD